MIPVKFFVRVQDQDPQIIYQIHLEIIKLPIKAFSIAGEFGNNCWGLSSELERKKVVEVLEKNNIPYSIVFN